MEQLRLKKIPFAIAFFSILMLVFGLLTKDYDGSYYYNKHKIPPLDLYDVNLFGWDVDYKGYMLFFIIILGVGIYLLLFTTDSQLNPALKIITARLNRPSPKKDVEVDKSEKMINSNVNQIVIKIVEAVTFIALLITFYLATSKQNSIWFFIILSFFYYLTLQPKSRKSIVLKSILYPLIFLLIFALAGSEDAYNLTSTKYYMSKHIIPFLISVTVIYFTQMYKLKNQTSFSFKNPLFWVAMLCLGGAILTLVLDSKI